MSLDFDGKPALGALQQTVADLVAILATGASTVVLRGDTSAERTVALADLEVTLDDSACTISPLVDAPLALPPEWSLSVTAGGSEKRTVTLALRAAMLASTDIDAALPVDARVLHLERFDQARDRFFAVPVAIVGGRLHPASIHALVAWALPQKVVSSVRWYPAGTTTTSRVWGGGEPFPGFVQVALGGMRGAELPSSDHASSVAPDLPLELRDAWTTAAGDSVRETEALATSGLPIPRVTIVAIDSVAPPRFRSPPTGTPALLVVPGDDGVTLAISSTLPREQRQLALRCGVGHTLLGHVRPGDVYAHWDTVETLSDPTPSRRWDRDVRSTCARWFDPERPRSLEECTTRDKALLGLHRMISDRLGGAGAIAEEAVRYQRAAYQRQAAQRLVAQLDAHRGAMLCDGVGLGKTYVATTVIVHYAAIARRDTRITAEDPFRVTVLSPASVVETWEREAIPPLAAHGVSLEHVRVISHTKLSRVTPGSALLEPGRGGVSDLEHLLFSDLVVIDEAHNFRASSARRTLVLRDLLRLRVRRARARRTLLLTATPINNSLEDLEQEVSLLFAEPITLSGPTQTTDVAWERAARAEVRQRIERAVKSSNRQQDVIERILLGPDGRVREAFRFRDDLQLGTMQLGLYLKSQEKLLKELRDRVRGAAALGVDEGGPRPRIADELLDRIVVQRSRALCKQIEAQEGGRTALLFRRDPGEPECLRYADVYDGTENVLATFLPLFDESEGEGTRPLTFKVYLWRDVELGVRTADESSPAVGLQRALVLKRLESSPVSFLITVLRLAMLHAARLNALVALCNEAGLSADARRVSQRLQDVLRRQKARDLRVVRWLTVGDRPDDPADRFFQQLAGVHADDDEPDVAPVQFGLFDAPPTVDDGTAERARKLLALADPLLADFETLLGVVPRLANVVFGRFALDDWPGGFARKDVRRRWPQSRAWADRVVTDPKLAKLVKKLLLARREGRKVLVFSQFTDTLDYARSVLDACRALPREDRERLLRDLELDDPKAVEFDALLDCIAVVTGDTEDRDRVVDRFAPYYRLRPFPPPGTLGNDWEADWIAAMKRPVDVLLASDVLAEGVNLQDVSVLVNFDIHWNPVRMIQRAGRIDRRLDPRIEEVRDFPALQQIAQRPGEDVLRVPAYYWHGHTDEAPELVNMILPDALEEELSLRERIATKTLAIDFTLGLERGTGAEADWMRDYRYRGVASLNAYQSDRAIERLGARYRAIEKLLAERGVDLGWADNLNIWIRDRGADDATPVLARALLSTSLTSLKPYARYLEPTVADGVAHWLWDTEPASALLAAWLPLGADHIGEVRKDLPYRAEASRRLRPEHILAASVVVLSPQVELVERPSDDAVGAEVFQGLPAVAAGFFGSRDDRLDLQMDQVVIFQLRALMRTLTLIAEDGDR